MSIDAPIGKSRTLIQVADLHKTFVIKRGFPRAETTAVRAVAGVTFSVDRGEVFGIVGESGCGKSTVGRCLLQLIEPTSGNVRFDGIDLVHASKDALRTLRPRMQIIFQDPYSSLNPRRTVGQTLSEPLRVHAICARQDIEARVDRVLGEVGLPPEAKYRYPHEFSGGQRQRIAIARALIFEPDLIVADEPVSALDVSVQSQILLLLSDLKRRRDLSFVFISHDLGVVRYFCSRVAVMYLGRIVEQGSVPGIFDEPLHPYTRMLRDASPVPDPEKRVAFARIEGEVPSPSNPPSGCHFHPRCPKAMDICSRIEPQWTPIDAHRGVACHLYTEDMEKDTNAAVPTNSRATRALQEDVG